MPCPSQISAPPPRKKIWSDAPGLPGGMVTLGIDLYIIISMKNIIPLLVFHLAQALGTAKGFINFKKGLWLL